MDTDSPGRSGARFMTSYDKLFVVKDDHERRSSRDAPYTQGISPGVNFLNLHVKTMLRGQFFHLERHRLDVCCQVL